MCLTALAALMLMGQTKKVSLLTSSSKGDTRYGCKIRFVVK